MKMFSSVVMKILHCTFLKQSAEARVDNIRMAGYMEKLPVKSNQKKVLFQDKLY